MFGYTDPVELLLLKVFKLGFLWNYEFYFE